MRTKLFAAIAFIALVFITGCAKDRTFEPVQLPDLPELMLVDPAAEQELAIDFARTMFIEAAALEPSMQPAMMALVLRFVLENSLDPMLIAPDLTIEKLKALANPPKPAEPPLSPSVPSTFPLA